jgi:hypothetical protein
LFRGAASNISREAAEQAARAAAKAAKVAASDTASKAARAAAEKAVKDAAIKTSRAKGDSLIGNVAGTLTEVGGYVIDPLEKIGDEFAIFPKKGLGISTITLTPGGRTVTSTDSKKSSGSAKQPARKGGTYDVRTGTYTDSQGNKQSMSRGNVPTDAKIVGTGGVIPPGIIPPGTIPPEIPDPKIPDPIIPDPVLPEDPPKDDDKSNVDDKTNVPIGAFTQIPNTIPVIVPNRFFFPGFFPIAMGESSGARERTKIYDELAAAGRRFQQISGLPFVQQQSIKRKKTVMINGKEFRIGKRVKK